MIRENYKIKEIPFNVTTFLPYIWNLSPFLNFIPGSWETHKFYRERFCALLFTIAKLWKQPRCPTTDEWIKKMWFLYTMEFYAAMKKNEMLSFVGKWMELENIILSEVSLAQKTKNHMFSLICGH
jgi:hypothetical protein